VLLIGSLQLPLFFDLVAIGSQIMVPLNSLSESWRYNFACAILVFRRCHDSAGEHAVYEGNGSRNASAQCCERGNYAHGDYRAGYGILDRGEAAVVAHKTQNTTFHGISSWLLE